ncbi:MAG TPA: NAD(P)/FAD-dependent oxidoreductase [Gammaproteobacteria bacterium]|nr:NAD(P)/FAD-dependent oxidoreductase [Gammaproteobacteria bacterium]
MSKFTRRRFIQLGGASLLAAGAAAGGDSPKSGPDRTAAINDGYLRKAALPEPKGPRVVVLGGGWGGLTMARYLKKFNPAFDVVLVDRKSLFISCPLSNIWMADQIPMEFLSHSYLDAAKSNDYQFFHASAVDLDRASKRLYTDSGYIGYDYLVLAPGIDYDYARIGVTEIEEQYRLRTEYPGGFIDFSEHLAIKRKLHSFQGGNFVLTVPAGNYRCMAAPYERACMAAAIFKKRDIKAKVLLLDMNADIRIKKDGFRRAFSTFYPDMIEYMPATEISGVDLDKREVITDFDTIPFDDAVIYPPVRASRLIENFGLALSSSPQKEADVDQFKYHFRDDQHVYVVGDARPQPFSKSGNTAYSEAKYVAELIAAHAKGKEIPWRSPQTMCFSGVRIDPLEAMSIIAFYQYDKKEKTFEFDRVHMIEKWSVRNGQAGLAWGEGIFRDLFYS